jgi:DNA-binding GntR family transcriptional regulator
MGVPTSRSDLVAGTLRSVILSGGFRPGQILVERQLAAQLGVSKTPVREALIALASSGLVTISRNHGVAVRTLTASEVRDIYELRLLLEPWAVGQGLIRAAGVVDVADSALDAARAALDEADTSAERGDAVASSLASRRFHRELYSRTGNELVIAQLNQMQDLIALALLVAEVWKNGARPVGPRERAEHRAMLAAAATGDAVAAERLTREHIEHAMAALDLGGS